MHRHLVRHVNGSNHPLGFAAICKRACALARQAGKRTGELQVPAYDFLLLHRSARPAFLDVKYVDGGIKS